MKTAVIFNPTAGNARHQKRIKQLQKNLISFGHELDLLSTGGPGDATRLANQAVNNGIELVLAIGGDGTINEVIQGMAGSQVPLAVYPAGTTNVWCKQVGMPVDPKRAARIISWGPRRLVDLGLADGRYFLLMAGIGIDAEVTRAIDLELKKRLGKFAYVVQALRLGFLFRGTTARIVLEPGSTTERTVLMRTSMVVITNAERYAIVKLAPEAQVDDGQLELLVFQGSNPWDRVIGALSVLFNLSEHISTVKRFRVRRAKIETYPPVAVQLDGDPTGAAGPKPLEITCVPAALRVVVPVKAPAHLFSHHVP